MTKPKDAMDALRGMLTKKFDVVAVYDLYEGEEVKLASDLEVLQGLREGGSRDPYFLKNIVAELDPSYPVAKNQRALDILAGTDKSGLRMTSVLTKHEGVPTYLPMIEDTMTGKLLVVGPKAAGGAENWTEFTYVNAEDKNKADAVWKINEFLVNAARYRGEQGLLRPSEVGDLVENLVKATAIMGDLKGIFMPAGVCPADTTVGQCLVEIAQGNATMGAYSMAGQKTTTPSTPKA